jgi:AcrR family transcriptional regulator
MGIRERRRAETSAAIMATARRHLAEHGAAELSLRAVARDVGLVSSAVYRYVASRDDLLTALIVEAYEELGAAAEQAEAKARADGAPVRERWRAVWRAARAWALSHPAQWTLIYGSPVPGYQAPETTIPAAGRLAQVLIELLVETGARPPQPPAEPVVTAVTEIPGVPHDCVPAAITSWTQLIGAIGFELFGHYRNVVLDPATYLDHLAETAATAVGLPPTPAS